MLYFISWELCKGASDFVGSDDGQEDPMTISTRPRKQGFLCSWGLGGHAG